MEIFKNRTEYLNRVKELLKPNPTCMEIGVDKGLFSRNILDILEPKKLVLVDPFNTLVDPISKAEFYPLFEHRTVYSTDASLMSVNDLMSDEITNGKVVIDRNLSIDAVNNYKDKTFDFIYIDACHIYESVLWDIENYFPKLKKGGLLGGHDYVDYQAFGVIRAVNEFCEKNGYEIIVLTDDSAYGDWVLSPKK
jgi:hypothetical protein